MLKEIINDFSVSATVAGIIAVLISYSGPAVIIFQAAKVAELSPELLSSWIFAISVASGVAGLILSLRFKSPIICAWSTPGAALLVLSFSNYSYGEAIGAFIVSSVLIIIFGFTDLFEKAMKKLPTEIVAALLAGILFRFGVDLFKSAENDFVVFIIMMCTYLLVKKFSARHAVLLSLSSGILFSVVTGSMSFIGFEWSLTTPILSYPEFSLTSLFGLALPIFVVTMASQNAPGIGVLRTAGYDNVPISPLISTTGVLSFLFAPFGSHAINLAAITASICTNEEAHPDKSKRYIAGVVCGLLYVVVGFFGGTITEFFFSIPEAIITVIAGLALLSSIMSNISLSVENVSMREPAVITFLVTASNITLLGIGSAFWGLIIGLVVMLVNNDR